MKNTELETSDKQTWLSEKRKLSLERFNEQPLPRRGLNLWRYTDPNKFIAVPNTAGVEAKTGRQPPGAENEKKNLANGHLAALAVDFACREIGVEMGSEARSKGVVVSSLSAAVLSHPEIVEKYLYSLINDQFGKFEAMNGAMWNDGIFVYVPKNITIEKPIHLVRESAEAGASQFPRLLIVIGENAEATIIDEYRGGSLDSDKAPTQSNGAVEIIGLANSRTRYVSLQRQGSGVNAYLTHRARIEKSATMLTIPLAFGGSTTKQNFGVILDGQGADSKMAGLLFGTDYQHFDNHTLHHHSAGQTTSNINFKVVLKDKAHSAYTGLIRIDKTAKTCAAYQENRNLLLNPGTKAETVPELEILNEDVSCTHGATVGPIDPLQLFYLSCRGIAHKDAVRMIVSGYVASTFGLLPEDLREQISAYVTARLEEI